VQVSGTQVTILSDVSEAKTQIDVSRAEVARDAAQAALIADAADEAAAADLGRAELRLRVAAGE
jgi:F0F1-type ATP synthase epsilon subunit